ncbi:ArsR family transcriptional regulator [Halogeometricum sp. wsp3]|nr:ArsR family transcriptional regulator [Halogeometricum sp. wsp3]
MSLLPSRDPATPDAEPRVIGVDSDDADDVLSALSAETARNLLSELNKEPAPPSELADRVDTSLQNAQYHLKKLKNAGAVEVVDTAYSEKGREVDVFAPANQPLVICAGDEQETAGLRTALRTVRRPRIIIGFGRLFFDYPFGSGVFAIDGPTVSSGSADTGTRDPSFDPGNTTVTDGGFEATAGALDTAARAVPRPPPLRFRVGGVLRRRRVRHCRQAALWYMRQCRLRPFCSVI